MNTHTIELDLSKNGLCANVVRVGQGDRHGTTIKARIYDEGAEVPLSGLTCYLNVLLPNKRNYYRASCEVSGNTATAALDESKLCAVAGYTDEAYFTCESADAKYSTERFAIEILRSVTDGKQPAKDSDDAITDLINRGNAAASKAEEAAARANRIAEDAEAAEAARARAEAERAASEATRRSGEAAREAAEQARQDAFDYWLEHNEGVKLSYVDEDTAKSAIGAMFGKEG